MVAVNNAGDRFSVDLRVNTRPERGFLLKLDKPDRGSDSSVLVCKCVCKCTGVLVCKSTGVKMYLCANLLVCKCVNVQMGKCAIAGVLASSRL